MSTFAPKFRLRVHIDMIKTHISLQGKGAYTAPEVELMSLVKSNSLLMIFSGDIEIWEDDEDLIVEP